MVRKLLFALNGLPSYGNHGGAQTCMALIGYLVKNNFDITVLSLYDTSKDNPYCQYKEKNEKDVRALGVRIRYIEYDNTELERKKFQRKSRILKFFSPRIKDYYPWEFLRDEFSDLLESFCYDVVFSYHFEPLSFFQKKLPAIHIGAIGDPTHTPIESQYRYYKTSCPKRALKLLLHTIYAKKVYYPAMKAMLDRCDIKAAFAGHYSEWLPEIKVSGAKYFRTPVSDPFSSPEMALKERKKNLSNDVIKILLLGSSTGTATRIGLEYFFQEVYPILKEKKVSKSFEIHIIGGGALPSSIKEAVECDDRIIERGRIEPISPEISSSHIFLVPIPIDLGIRVRIITALAHAAPLVAHIANKAGIPELINEENSLLSGNPSKMTEHIITLFDKNINKKYSNSSRVTFDKYFSIEKAGEKILRVINECL